METWRDTDTIKRLQVLGFHCLSGSLPSWVKAAFYLSFHCIIEIFLKKKHWAASATCFNHLTWALFFFFTLVTLQTI
uniref:Uncharacterized protein n=1 Tax=Helianthus annuus TaxID=4232 RepID=A0A251UPQ2_HELAN